MQNYKTLHVAVTVCATLVNTQTHTLTDRQAVFLPATPLAQLGELIITHLLSAITPFHSAKAVFHIQPIITITFIFS